MFILFFCYFWESVIIKTAAQAIPCETWLEESVTLIGRAFPSAYS